mgnify:CR=1 FL=1|tara:strand:+ start:873 stop:1376 length:504 start_codon:yes stop_codon:yes gene_type:complete
MRTSVIQTRSITKNRKNLKFKQINNLKKFEERLEKITAKFAENTQKLFYTAMTHATEFVQQWEFRNKKLIINLVKEHLYHFPTEMFKLEYHTSDYVLNMNIDFEYFDKENRWPDEWSYDCECVILTKNKINKKEIKQLVKNNIMIQFGENICNEIENRFNFDIEWFE